jgi:hypothetical protein
MVSTTATNVYRLRVYRLGYHTMPFFGVTKVASVATMFRAPSTCMHTSAHRVTPRDLVVLCKMYNSLPGQCWTAASPLAFLVQLCQDQLLLTTLSDQARGSHSGTTTPGQQHV